MDVKKNKSIVLHNAIENLSKSYLPTNRVQFMCNDGNCEINIEHLSNVGLVRQARNFATIGKVKPCASFDLTTLPVKIDTSHVHDFIAVTNKNAVDFSSYSLQQLKRFEILSDYLDTKFKDDFKACCIEKEDTLHMLYKNKGENLIRKEMQAVISGQHPKVNNLKFKRSLIEKIKDSPDGKRALLLLKYPNTNILNFKKCNLTHVDALLIALSLLPKRNQIIALDLAGNNLTSAQIQDWSAWLPQLKSIKLSHNKISILKASDILFLFRPGSRYIKITHNPLTDIETPDIIPKGIYNDKIRLYPCSHTYLVKQLTLDKKTSLNVHKKFRIMLKKIGDEMDERHQRIKYSLLRSAAIDIYNITLFITGSMFFFTRIILDEFKMPSNMLDVLDNVDIWCEKHRLINPDSHQAWYQNLSSIGIFRNTKRDGYTPLPYLITPGLVAKKFDPHWVCPYHFDPNDDDN